jgi:uncharacterized protein (TIGR02466 family)
MIKSLFPVQIYKTNNLSLAQLLLEKLTPKLETVWDQSKIKNQGSMRAGGLCSYDTIRDLHTWPETNDFCEFLKHHVQIFWKELDYYSNPYIKEMWANRYVPGSWIEWHNHIPAVLSASFYLQQSPKSGNLVFKNPLDDLLRHQPFNNICKGDYYNSFENELEIKTGDLVIWPGWMSHRTLPNNDQFDRIMIGANINCLW